MKCEQCDSEATVHELRVTNGKRVERHLCERCARQQGIPIQTSMSVPEIIETMVEQNVPAKPKEAPRATACGHCGTTYAEFRKTGLLGCAECYPCFEQQLGPLLDRAHQGGTHHVGKLPRRALSGERAAPSASRPPVLGDPGQRASRIATLRKQLDDAVSTEQYERAATLRDELRKLTELENQPPGAGA